MAGHRGATARKAEKQSRKRVDSDDASIAALVEEMCVDALAGLPPAKIEEILRPWLAKAAPLDPNDPSAASFLIEALTLAGCLALFTPTLMGAAPIERYAKQRRAGEQRLLAQDLASGATVSLLDDTAPESAMLVDVATWLAPLPGGDFVAVGPLLPLDETALAEARSFIRPGKGLVNPRRCAAAVYRHVVRHGGLRVEGLNGFSEPPTEAEASVEEWDALDALAAAFLTAEGETPPALIQEARELASVDTFGELAVRRPFTMMSPSPRCATAARFVKTTRRCESRAKTPMPTRANASAKLSLESSASKSWTLRRSDCSTCRARLPRISSSASVKGPRALAR